MSTNPEDWPNHQDLSITDEEALIMAKLILEGKPRSYVEGAIRLARYVIALHQQADELEKLIEETAHDTLPEIETDH